MKKKVLIVFGAYLEAIKMTPLVNEFQQYTDIFETSVCVTSQHRQIKIMSHASNPYGDGTSSEKIVKFLIKKLKN